MANIVASELNALQTRINTERGRRGLSDVTFTDGLKNSGDTIKAVHFTELRNYVESLNTKNSVTFTWTGSTAAGASITSVLPQIDTYLTTLENEALASWKILQPSYFNAGSDAPVDVGTHPPHFGWDIPQSAWAQGNVYFEITGRSAICEDNPWVVNAPDGNPKHISTVNLFVTSDYHIPLCLNPGWCIDGFCVGRIWDSYFVGNYNTKIKSFRHNTGAGVMPPNIDESDLCTRTKIDVYGHQSEKTNDDTIMCQWSNTGYAIRRINKIVNCGQTFDSTFNKVLLYVGSQGNANLDISMFGNLWVYY